MPTRQSIFRRRVQVGKRFGLSPGVPMEGTVSRSTADRRLLSSCVTACLVLLVVGSADSVARLDHGSSCSNQRECETRNVLLKCVDGICTCPQNEQSVVLDVETGLCSGTVDSSCYRTRAEPLNSEEEVNPVKHYVPCIQHAACSRPARVCTCDRRYYPSPDKKSCLPQKGYDESCSEDEECDIFRYFGCVGGRCGCTSDMEYHEHETQGTCFKPIGSNCTRDNVYDNTVFPGRYDACPINAECYHVCACRPQFTVSSDGFCKGLHGSRCDPDRPCSDIQFVCQNQKCVCKYPLHQVLNVTSGQCISRVPGPCSTPTPEILGTGCVDNAECIEGQCRCVERYRQDKDGFCLKPHGYDCELDRECSPLVCINNQCSCPDLLQHFDRETGKCLGDVGSRCLLDPQESTNPCAQNSHCKAFGSDTELGTTGECVLSSTGGSLTNTSPSSLTGVDYRVLSEDEFGFGDEEV